MNNSRNHAPQMRLQVKGAITLKPPVIFRITQR